MDNEIINSSYIYHKVWSDVIVRKEFVDLSGKLVAI